MKAFVTIYGKVLKGKRQSVYQGGDIPITVFLKADDGTDIVIDDLTELHLALVCNGNTKKEFNKAGSGDADTLVKVDTKHYRADWLSADTQGVTVGEYTLEINVVESDAAYNDSEKNTVIKAAIMDMYISNIKDKSS